MQQTQFILQNHIRLIITRGNKITPYQNPNANVGPINFVIIPEYKKTDSNTYKNGITIGRVKNIRPSENILSPQLNTLSKLNCILASIEAVSYTHLTLPTNTEV
mgnify:CR=1 FL=1